MIGPGLGRLQPNFLVTSTATKSVSTTGTMSGHAEKRVSAIGYTQRIDDQWHCQRLSPRGETIRRFHRRCVHGRVGDFRNLSDISHVAAVGKDSPPALET